MPRRIQKQEVKTPPISKCWCNAPAKVEFQEEGHDLYYRVRCDNGHIMTKFIGSRHKAICRWNHRVGEIEFPEVMIKITK
jgi:hypothetical protein